MNDEDEKMNPKKVRPVRPRPRRRRRRFGVWMLLSLVFLFGLLGLAGLSVSGRSVTAPDWVTEQVIRRTNQSIQGGRINLGRIGFSVNERGIPQLLLRDLAIYDARGAEMAHLNEVAARFSLPALIQGQIQPENLRLSGAQMTLRRRADGQFDLSFGSGSGASGTLPGVLDKIDQAFGESPLAGVLSLEADALTITVEDGRSGRIWQITDGRLTLTQDADNLDMSVAFDVFNGTEDLAEVILGIRTDRNSSAASVGATFQNAATADIALQSPTLSFLGVLDAPISGAIRADFDVAGTLGSLAGTLEIDAGALQPSVETRPIGFHSTKAYFSFNPKLDKLQFSEVSVLAGEASIIAHGHAYLRDYKEGWPTTFLGQFALANVMAAPNGMFTDPIRFSEGAVDFRLRLNPFTMDIGQLVLVEEDEKLMATGKIVAGTAGWEVATDIEVNQVDINRLLSLWPISFISKTRVWIAENIKSGLLSNIRAAARIKEGSDPKLAVGYQFQNTEVRYLKTLPNIVGASGYAGINGNTFSLSMESGSVDAPEGGKIDLAGSSMKIADIRKIPARADFKLKGSSTTTAALSMLNQPPFEILRRTEFGPDLAQGFVDFASDISFEMKKRVLLPDVSYSVVGTVVDVSSSKLIEDHVLAADALILTATPQKVEISGPVKIGDVGSEVTWVQKMGPDQVGRSAIKGTVELSQAFVDEFGIGLPDGTVSGQGVGEIDLQLVKDEPTRFLLTSDLNRVGLRIAPLGWSKPKNATGKLAVEGSLGDQPKVDRLDISATGLNASGGKVTLNEEGEFQTATFSRVTAGGWLDAPVILTGRGGAVPAVTLRGGSIDTRRATFGSSSTSSQGGPVTLALDRLVVSEGIVLTNFQGNFDTSSGMAGTFTAQVNGNTPVSGRLAPERRGTAVRVQSNNAGGVFKDAGVFDNAKGGDMDMTLRPQDESGVYRGRLTTTGTRVVGAPALTELLSAISIVGLLDQVNGPGIAFNDVQADFILSPRAVILTKSSAVGPSLGISLDGVYDLVNSRMDMQGVISPVYFLNGIGQIFSRRGEGLFGFTYRLTGSPDEPNVRANPLSILTPGMFREIFRKQPPKVTQ